MRALNIFLMSLALMMLLNSCGTKGPLYIPERQYPAKAK
jgi:predicted small lipoprotein YifL